MELLSKECYEDYCHRFNLVWQYLHNTSYEENSVISNICELRGYSLESNMPTMLSEVGFVYLDPDLFDESKISKFDKNKDLGLYTEEGKFLLMGRFIFPVKDMLGNVIALIGWYPDEKKYITTPSKFFSKKCLFFGMEQLKKTGIGKNYYVVEGIFDCISVRSLGFNCVAIMGISVSNYTKVLYSLFKKVIAIPDNDKEGRKVVVEDKWHIPSNGKYLRWNGSLKDIDDMIKMYDMSDILRDAWNEPDKVITIDC